MPVWKEVASDPRYSVSDEGEVRGPSGKILKGGTGKQGHKYVSIGRRGTQYVHRIVLEAFVGPCPEGMECRHLNGDPSDNRRANLQWGTRSEQRQDDLRNGANPWALKTHCPQNHEYNEENTRWYQGRRYCKACDASRTNGWERQRQKKAGA